MGTKLSHKLIDFDFFCALGTTQHAGPRRLEIIVKRGTPNTYDHNNGVTVVYDEVGRPWIRYGRHVPPHMSANEYNESINRLIGEYKLVRGASVPHSNDGGCFVREVLPTL